MKRSKLLTLIGGFYLLMGLYSLVGLPQVLASDSLFVAQALIMIAVQLGLATGLLMQKAWVIPLFLASVTIMFVLNGIWLYRNPPPQMWWGSAWIIATILNVFPGVLLFLRRDRLKSKNLEKAAGAI